MHLPIVADSILFIERMEFNLINMVLEFPIPLHLSQHITFRHLVRRENFLRKISIFIFLVCLTNCLLYVCLVSSNTS